MTEHQTPTTGPAGPLIETTLRVMTWNLWWRFGPWEARLPAILDTVHAKQPDVLALQEVWEEDGRSAAGLVAARLGEGYDSSYVSRFDGEGVRFGVAIVSRWPIAGHDARDLPAPDTSQEFRSVLRADIDGPRGPLQVFSTHLNWRFDESHIRQEQVRAIARFVKESPARSYPPILCGDFNAVPEADEVRMLTGKCAVPEARLVFHDAWEVAGQGPGTTWSNDNPYSRLDLEPDRRIDYVFVGWPKQGGAGQVVRAEVAGVEPVEGVVPSDHYAVVADLRY